MSLFRSPSSRFTLEQDLEIYKVIEEGGVLAKAIREKILTKWSDLTYLSVKNRANTLMKQSGKPRKKRLPRQSTLCNPIKDNTGSLYIAPRTHDVRNIDVLVSRPSWFDDAEEFKKRLMARR